MKVSIIIPVYNVENYIMDCLNSLYDGNLCDFEVICVDDRGKDKSISIIKKYVKENKITNLTIIKHDKNKGLSEARNTGIKIAKGEYIVFVDSDDMVNAKNLNDIIDYAKTNNLDVVEGEIEEIYETDLNIKSKESKKNRENTIILNGDEYFSECCKKAEYIPMVWCRAYKTDYIKGNYFFIPNLKFEDEEFSPRVIINAKKIQYLNKEIYIYRRRDDSITTAMIKDLNWIDHYIIIINNLLKYLETISNKISYFALNDRIANLTLSLLKNPIAYNATEENLNHIINIVKEKKLYKIPLKSKNILIKVQGFLMKYPRLFVRLYNMRVR